VTPFRAPNEYAFAAFFDALAVPYKYEALEPEISRAIRYQPDFWLPDSLAWVEIKPTGAVPTPGEIRVAWQLVQATGRPVYLVAGWPQADRLAVGVCAPCCLGIQTAMDKLAMRWFATLINRRFPDVMNASRAVMARRLEFVKLWMDSQKGK
jgi:hypothetical protein